MRRLVVALIALVLLAGACRGSEKASPAAGPASPGASASPAFGTGGPAARPEEEILAEESPPEPPKVTREEVKQVEGRPVSEIQLREFRFSPATLTAEAGETFNVRLFNFGKATHNFTIVTPESGTITKDVTPRVAEVLGFLAPKKPGRYAFSCRFHRDEGMTGTLVVR